MKINYAPVFHPLIAPARHKGAYGGRSSGKSRFFAQLLVARAVSEPGLHAVCIREVQNKLAQSSKRNIELTIASLGVSHLFDIQKAEIKTPGGGLIIFQGMNNQTADSLKSLESYDIAWVEEAQTLSKRSLTMLRPTMRKLGSEIWESWNPRHADDPVDAFFRGDEVHPKARVVRANWSDNPFFATGTNLEDERLFDLQRYPDDYEHVWQGGYEQHSEARVFSRWTTEWFEPPPAGTKLFAGADWGWVDPTVLVVCFIDGYKLYIWREAWALRLPINQCPRLFDKIDPNWTPQNAINPNWRSMARNLEIMADSSNPANITFMQQNGFPRMKAATKGPSSIEDGIHALQGYEIIVHPDCEHVIRELSRYSYKRDKRTNDVTSEIADKDNHTIDSLRYALENVRRRNTITCDPLPV